MHWAAVVGFLVAVLPLIATPGASLTLLGNRIIQYGQRQAAPVILGTVAGLYVHAVLAAMGLAAVVLRSSDLFAAVRLAGAAYLIGLGVWTWRAGGGVRPTAVGRHRRHRREGSTFVAALLANVLNPKAALIFLTLVPQFLDPARPLLAQFLILATAQALLVAGWLLGWTAVIGRTRRLFASSTALAVLRRVGATVLVGLGVRAAAV